MNATIDLDFDHHPESAGLARSSGPGTDVARGDSSDRVGSSRSMSKVTFRFTFKSISTSTSKPRHVARCGLTHLAFPVAQP
jgi:hypothetical protein